MNTPHDVDTNIPKPQKSVINPSLFALLLGPLSARPLPGHTEIATGEVEDNAYLEGLWRALEQDIAAGTLPDPPPARWLQTLVAKLLTPRHQSSDEPAIARHEWPSINAPWDAPEGVDPRERLMARLVHLGCNPWSPREMTASNERHLGDTLAAAMLAQGYPNLVRQAIALPYAPALPGDQKCMVNEPDDHNLIEHTLIQEAAWQNHTDLVGIFLAQGARVEGALRLARSPEMVTQLMQAGGQISETYGKNKSSVVECWLANRDSKTARALMQAAEAQMTPEQRLKGALKSPTWGVVNDALNSCPGWEEITYKLAKVRVRIPLNLLLRTTRSQQHVVKHAVRLFSKTPPDDREVAPGLSEKALTRLAIHCLLHQPCGRSNQADDKIKQQLNGLLDASSAGTQPTYQFSVDVAAFLACGEYFANHVVGHNIAQMGMSKSLVIPREYEVYEKSTCFRARTLEDMETLATAAKLITYNNERAYNQGHDGFKEFFGYDCKNWEDYAAILRQNDFRLSWLDRIVKDNPQHLDRVVTAMLRLLCVGLRSFSSIQAAGSQSQDAWAPYADRIQRLLDRGAIPNWSIDDVERFDALAKSNGNTPKSVALAEHLPSIIAHHTLQAQTEAASKSATRPRSRL